MDAATLDHATRPYYCPACRDTYPGRAAYLSHPCVRRVLPLVPGVATAEEPDRELARVSRECIAAFGRMADHLQAELVAAHDALGGVVRGVVDLTQQVECRQAKHRRA